METKRTFIYISVVFCFSLIHASFGLNESCNSTTDCATTYGAVCRSDTCKCDDGYIASGADCLAYVGGSCAGGSNCVGYPDTADCFSGVCGCASGYSVSDGDGTGGVCVAIWNQWSVWNACSVTCGGGTQIRTRACSVPDKCTGETTDSQTCNTGACLGLLQLHRVRRQEAALNESCDTNENCTVENSECSGSQGSMTCQCKTDYYMLESTCTKRDLGESCSTASQCEDANTVCFSNTCQCDTGFYSDAGTCHPNRM